MAGHTARCSHPTDLSPVLARYRRDGRLDASFGQGGIVVGFAALATATTLDAGGRIPISLVGASTAARFLAG